MRESIGTSFLLNFIVIFLVFVFAFLAGTLSYYKAYKVNNAILHAIEKYEGYNQLSIAEINNKLSSLGYNIDNIDCPRTRFVNGNSDIVGTLISQDSDGYCIYLYFNENAPKRYNDGVDTDEPATTNIYYSLGVATYMRLQIPVIGGLVRLPVYSKSYNIYYFPEWGKNETEILNKLEEQLGHEIGESTGEDDGEGA